MGCGYPLTAYRARGGGITFERSASLSGVSFPLPCGQCTSCRLNYSKEWAIRCMHEKQMWLHNEFITCTYSNEFLPEGGTLVKRHWQLFMKRLRKEYGYKSEDNPGVRYYACGEYGERTWRPHFHACMFNFLLPDKVFYTETKAGYKLYTSAKLDKYWGMGHCIVGDVDFDSAAYVSRYIVKRITGAKAGEHYEKVDTDGVVHNLIPEFALMSRDPGIASAWYDKYGSSVRHFDSVVINGREVKPPRFYDMRLELTDPTLLEKHKRGRRRRAAAQRSDNTLERRRVKDAVASAKLKLKGRTL